MEIKPTLTSITTDTADAKPQSKGAKEGDGAAAPLKFPSSAERADRITLTNIAETLGNLEAELGEFDGVDLERVDQLRQSIEEGSYEVDVDQLVQNLIRTEGDLEN